MSFLPLEFNEFIAPDTDRAGFIQKWLDNHGVKNHRIVIDGKNHILVQYDSKFYNPQFKIKTVIVHHDRVKDSPGANDNSAADYMIMNWAVRLKEYKGFHNVRIFFTDGEELGWKGVSEQGAYGLASMFKRLGIKNDDVYVFDACGRGEVPILSKVILPENTNKAFCNKFYDLFERTQKMLNKSSPGRWMCLPVPYSDNASFLVCGIPAVAITMLPATEASLYARNIINEKGLEEAVLNRASTKQKRIDGTLKDYSYKDRIPLTWKLFHSEKDNIESLTPESFPVMESILDTLADTKDYAE